MSRSIHLISNTIPGYGPSDGSRLPCSEISGKALCLSPRSCREHKLVSDAKFLSLKCVSRYSSSVCNASSSNYRRNPDFSKQNRQGYSRHRNRHNEIREEYEDVEESETLSTKNGPLLSVNNHKYQATATTGPREKEIVELFRKVQAQLRERAAMKEGKKIEESQAKSKESETVDSLLKLLRKHSVQQGKKSNTTANSRGFILDQEEQIVPLTEGRSTSISDSTRSMKHKTQEIPIPQLSRPKSNFRKRSPVPEIKFQPVYSEDSGISVSENDNVDSERQWSSSEPEANDVIHDVEYDSESDVNPLTSEVVDAFDEVPEYKTSETDETEHDDIAKEDDLVEARNLNGMKLTELRALAKSRGMKGFSKLKKNELIGVLSGGST